MADDIRELRLRIWDTAAEFFDEAVNAEHPDYVPRERAFEAAIDALIAAVRAESRCDCGAALTLCRDCAVADYQAAHTECRTCCPIAPLGQEWVTKVTNDPNDPS